MNTFPGQSFSNHICKQLLHDLKEARRYWKLKEEAQDKLLGELSLEELIDLLQDKTTNTNTTREI
jgi:hypothetical protein